MPTTSVHEDNMFSDSIETIHLAYPISQQVVIVNRRKKKCFFKRKKYSMSVNNNWKKRRENKRKEKKNWKNAFTFHSVIIIFT